MRYCGKGYEGPSPDIQPGGFSKGYLEGKTGKDMMSLRSLKTGEYTWEK